MSKDMGTGNAQVIKNAKRFRRKAPQCHLLRQQIGRRCKRAELVVEERWSLVRQRMQCVIETNAGTTWTTVRDQQRNPIGSFRTVRSVTAELNAASVN